MSRSQKTSPGTEGSHQAQDRLHRQTDDPRRCGDRTIEERNTSSKHWTRWTGIENRCVVPFKRFAEPDPASKVEGGHTPNAWFARDESEPLMFFAGLWVRNWQCIRRINEGPITATSSPY
jgi:putative SOS response-associated peptidase YedK